MDKILIENISQKINQEVYKFTEKVIQNNNLNIDIDEVFKLWTGINSKKIICKCGSSIDKQRIKHHEKTLKHQNYIKTENKTRSDIMDDIKNNLDMDKILFTYNFDENIQKDNNGIEIVNCLCGDKTKNIEEHIKTQKHIDYKDKKFREYYNNKYGEDGYETFLIVKKILEQYQKIITELNENLYEE